MRLRQQDIRSCLVVCVGEWWAASAFFFLYECCMIIFCFLLFSRSVGCVKTQRLRKGLSNLETTAVVAFDRNNLAKWYLYLAQHLPLVCSVQYRTVWSTVLCEYSRVCSAQYIGQYSIVCSVQYGVSVQCGVVSTVWCGQHSVVWSVQYGVVSTAWCGQHSIAWSVHRVVRTVQCAQ